MIFFTLKSKIFWIFFVILLGSICGIYWLKGHSAPQLIGEAFFSIKTDKKVAALTFDDGPSTPYTQQILDILKKHDIKATFFLLGSEVQKYPDLVERIYTEGHEIGNHSWSHARLIFKTPTFIREEIESTDQLIRRLGYTGPLHFRAPYGNKLLILPWILKNMDRPHILFDVIPKDWELTSPQIIAQRVGEQLHPGAIILLHDGGGERSNTVNSLELILAHMKENNYQLLTISELLKLDEKRKIK